MGKRFWQVEPRGWAWVLAAAAVVLAFSSVPVHAESAAFLSSSQESGRARYETLRDADEIYSATFIHGNDETGLAHLAMLRERAKAGKKVHLLLDATANELPLAMLKYLTQDPALGGNFQIKIFNPFQWQRPFRYNRRSHVKLSITVNRERSLTEVITGGRNLRNDFFNVGKTGPSNVAGLMGRMEAQSEKGYVHHQRDADIYAAGKVAEEAKDYFLQIWNSPDALTPSGVHTPRDFFSAAHQWIKGNRRSRWDSVTPDEMQAEARRLDEAAIWLERNPIVARGAGAAWRSRLRDIPGLRLSRDSMNDRQSQLDLIELIRSAREHIVLANPFFLPTEALRNALWEARKRKVRIDVVTSRVQDIEQPLARAAFEMQLKDLLEVGAHLWGYDYPAQVHKKLAVIDGRRWYVGTFNLDPRAAKWNLEEGIIGEDAVLAEDIMKQLRRDLHNSTEMEPPPIHRLAKRCATGFQSFVARVVDEFL